MSLGSQSSLLIVCAFGTLIFSLGFGAVLSYHWVRYAMSPVIASAAIMLYWLVSTILLLTLFGAALITS